MPGQYSFESDLIRLSFDGETSLSALEALMDDALSDPACPTKPGLFVDLRASTSIGRRSSDDMKQAVGMFNARSQKLSGRFAIVTHPGVQYGVMRMAGAYSDGVGLVVRIFEAETEALEWLRSS